jgi:hypothetical protein
VEASADRKSGTRKSPIGTPPLSMTSQRREIMGTFRQGCGITGIRPARTSHPNSTPFARPRRDRNARAHVGEDRRGRGRRAVLPLSIDATRHAARTHAITPTSSGRKVAMSARSRSPGPCGCAPTTTSCRANCRPRPRCWPRITACMRRGDPHRGTLACRVRHKMGPAGAKARKWRDRVVDPDLEPNESFALPGGCGRFEWSLD